jgi:hypothetical protein
VIETGCNDLNDDHLQVPLLSEAAAHPACPDAVDPTATHRRDAGQLSPPSPPLPEATAGIAVTCAKWMSTDAGGDAEAVPATAATGVAATATPAHTRHARRAVRISQVTVALLRGVVAQDGLRRLRLLLERVAPGARQCPCHHVA